MGNTESFEASFRRFLEEELVRREEIQLMWGTKLPIMGRIFKPTLYQTHMKYLVQVLKLTGL